MVFIVHELQEKFHNYNKGLYAMFVDFIKASDTMSRKGLWLMLECLGCPKIVDMIIELLVDHHGKIKVKGEL